MSEAIFIARGDLLSSKFVSAVRKIRDSKVLDIKTTQALGKFVVAAEEAFHKTREKFVDLVKEYVNVKLDGNFETTETGVFKWKEGVDGKVAEDAIQTFGNFKTPILSKYLTLDMLRLCDLTPGDVAALGPVIQDPEIEKQA